MIPRPIRERRLPGPSHGYRLTIPLEKLQGHELIASAIDPLGSVRPNAIQSAVIADKPEIYANLTRWLSTWDPMLITSTRRTPAGWSDAQAAIACAWILDNFRGTPADRSLWVEQVIACLELQRRLSEQSRLTWWNSTAWNRKGAAPLWCALALAGECPQDLWDWAVQDTIHALEIIPHMLDGGAWSEGLTYWGQGGRAVYQILAAIDSAYGLDLVRQTPYVRDSLRMVEYLIRPDGAPIGWGDQHTYQAIVGPSAWNSFEAYREVANATGDPHALQRIGQQDPWSLPLFPWGHTAALGQAVPAPPALPLARHFNAAGIVSMRDVWRGEDSTVVTIQAAGPMVSHEPVWPGHFTIFGRGTIAGESGSYAQGAMSAQNRLYRRHFGGNHLRIIDAADQSSDYTERVVIAREGSRDIFADMVLPNGGGPKRVDSGWQTKPITLADRQAREEEYRVATVRRHVHTDRYDHVEIDCAPAYQSFPGAEPHIGRTRRVEAYTRHMVWLRAEGAVIIADLVHLTKPDLTLEWVMHTRTAPQQVGGAVWRVSNEQDVEHQWGWPRGMKYRQEDGKYRYAAGAFVDVLRPEGPDQLFATRAVSDWSQIDGTDYRGHQQPAYPNHREWEPTDATKGPAEACGHYLSVLYRPNGQTFRALCHVVTMQPWGRGDPSVEGNKVHYGERVVEFLPSGAVEVR